MPGRLAVTAHLIISALETVSDPVELVERKGLGHPDTICNALAEALSRNSCREYRRRFGDILHHNVGKALLCGGRATRAFGGGEVIAPINIYMAGRAISEVGAERLSIQDIVIESSQGWLRSNMRDLDAELHVRIHALIQPGSQDLQTLFSRRDRSDAPLANDTSGGVGHAPLGGPERLVRGVEKHINGRDRHHDWPALGEDVNVMGVRRGEGGQLTVACP